MENRAPPPASGKPPRRRRQNPTTRPPGEDAAHPALPADPAALARTLTSRSTPAVRVVSSGIDTLHVFTRATVDPGVARRLEQAQTEAKAAAEVGRTEGQPHEVAGRPFVMRPYGARTAPYLLDLPDVMAVLVNPSAAPGFPTVTVELRALFLWNDGPAAAVRAVDEVFAAIVNRVSPEDRHVHVSRLDVCADFQGWQPDPTEGFIAAADEDRTRYVTRAQDFSAFTVTMRTGPFRGRQFSGFSWGHGEVVCRLYDKTLEAERSAKASAMREVWSRSGAYVEGERVWRLEYQLRREAIAALRVAGREVGTWDQLVQIIRQLWLYLATRWLVRRAPRTRTSRQALTPEWDALAAQAFDRELWPGLDADLYRAKREDQASRLTPQLAGYLSRALAEEMYFAPGRAPGELPELSLDEAWPQIARRVRAHAAQKGRELEERAEEKVAHWDETALASALDKDRDQLAPDPFADELDEEAA